MSLVSCIQVTNAFLPNSEIRDRVCTAHGHLQRTARPGRVV